MFNFIQNEERCRLYRDEFLLNLIQNLNKYFQIKIRKKWKKEILTIEDQWWLPFVTVPWKRLECFQERGVENLLLEHFICADQIWRFTKKKRYLFFLNIAI